MRLAMFQPDVLVLQLTEQLRRGGAGEFSRLEQLTVEGFDLLLLPRSLHNDPDVKAALRGQICPVFIAGLGSMQSLTQPCVELLLDPDEKRFLCHAPAGDAQSVRIKQYLSICLLRAGFSPSHSAAPKPQRSWEERLLPACEMGLPCDDCGRCH